MSNSIAIRTAGGSGLAKPGQVNVGSGSSTEGLSFSGRAEEYSDLPTTFRKGASKSTELVLARETRERQAGTSIVLASAVNIQAPVNLPPKIAEGAIASGVRTLSKSFKNGSRIVQRKLGWFASPTYIYVTTVERELAFRDDKKLAPVSEWLIENRRKWTPVGGVASKRVGKVNERPDYSETLASSDRYVEEAEVIPDAFANGVNAMGYLPKTVRGDIALQVPNPTYFDGRLLGIVNPKTKEVDTYEVTLLRMNDNVGLVISATCPIGGSEWTVTQARYQLTTPEVESA